MALLGAAKLADEMLRLVWRSDWTAALDLKSRHAEVHAWFAGAAVYGTMQDPTYPPATFAMLWPFLGWLPFEPARWLWAATTVVALAAMTWLILRESGATGAWERAFVALMLLAMNETGVAIGNGQLILHVLPILVFGLLLIYRGSGSLAEDLTASACVLFAMVKVTLAAPFLWLVLLAPNQRVDSRWRVRPTLLVAAGYVALTFFAASFQDGNVVQQLRDWMRVVQAVSTHGGDYANLNAWLTAAGLARLVPAVSVGTFIALGIWLYRYRHGDLWVRLGVVAIFTRFWAYHRLYDDVLVVLALVALFRITTSVVQVHGAKDRHVRAAAIALIATSMVFLLLPARLGTSPTPWHQLFDLSHAVTWFGMLSFLCWHAQFATDQPAAREASR